MLFDSSLRKELARSFGATLVVLVIPLALLSTFMGLKIMGVPANLLSLGAMDFGIIVDGAVIVIENIMHRLAQRGEGMNDKDPTFSDYRFQNLFLFNTGYHHEHHTFPNVPPDTIAKHPGRVGRSVFFTIVSGFQMNLVNILAAVIAANVLERYPNIRIAFGESGCGWIPYALDRMDFEWEDRFTDLGLKMKPSDYWRRQCKATFQYDRIGAKLIDDMGAESLMWGSDYPHGDGVWPNSDKFIKEQFADVSPEVTRMITCTNAGKFYGLIN